MIRIAVMLGLLAPLGACQRDQAAPAADEPARLCNAAADSLATDLAGVDAKLRDALARDRAQAARLLRESVELVIVTRELQCAIVERSKVERAMTKIENVRKAFDALLVATTSPQRPVDEAALVDRFSRALLGQP